LETIAQLDLAFSEDRAEDMGSFFAEDARLMFPHTEDIVGRKAIQQAFVHFMKKYITNSFSPKRELIDVYEHRAYTLGHFIEIRTPRDRGPTEKVYGRLLEIWQLTPDDKWQIIYFMTGRYAETEMVE
jgi:ketosteroid isomerase-like protein